MAPGISGRFAMLGDGGHSESNRTPPASLVKPASRATGAVYWIVHADGFVCTNLAPSRKNACIRRKPKRSARTPIRSMSVEQLTRPSPHFPPHFGWSLGQLPQEPGSGVLLRWDGTALAATVLRITVQGPMNQCSAAPPSPLVARGDNQLGLVFHLLKSRLANGLPSPWVWNRFAVKLAASAAHSVL